MALAEVSVVDSQITVEVGGASLLAPLVAAAAASAVEAANEATAAAVSAALVNTAPVGETNLYNPATATSGDRLSTSDGTVSAQPADFVSDFIGPLVANTVLTFKTGAGRRHAVYSSATVGGTKTFISGDLGQRVFATGSNSALFYWVKIGGAVADISTAELEEGFLATTADDAYVARLQMPSLRLTETQARERLFDPATLILDTDLRVDEHNLPFTRIGTNLFDTDPRNIANDYALLSAGDTISTAGTSIARIPVSPSTTYSFAKKSGEVVITTSPQVYEYTAAGVFVADSTAATKTTGSTGAYLLVEFLTADLNNMMVVQGTTLPRLYVPYKRYALPSHVLRAARKYEGQKLWFMSDSIGVPPTAWPWIVAKEQGLANYPGDDTIAAATAETGGSWTNESTRPNVGGSSPELRTNYGVEAGNDHSVSHFYNRVQYLDTSRLGVIVQGGTNAWGTPYDGGMVAGDACNIGSLSAQMALYQAAIAATADPEDTVDGRTTMGAMILLFHKLQTLFPAGPIYFIGAFPRVTMYETSGKIGLTQAATVAGTGIDLPTYNEYLAQVCRRFGVPFYNPFERTVLRPLIAANYAANYQDATHPTDVAGQALIGADISRWIDGFAF